MLFDMFEMAENYQYPIVAFENNSIIRANACAKLFLGGKLENMRLDELLGKRDAGKVQKAFKESAEWSGRLTLGGVNSEATLVVINGTGCVVIKPNARTYREGFLLDYMLSDMGQMMKEPLANLYAAIQEIEKHAPDCVRRDIGSARRSFYELACLSENEIALAPAPHLDEYNTCRLLPMRETVGMIAASANEALGDRKISISVELAGNEFSEEYCRVYEKKLVQLLMLLFANASHGLTEGETAKIGYRVNDGSVSIEIPVRKEMISVFDFSDYMNVAGTALAQEPLERRMFAKIAESFNNIHGSKIFPSKTADGQSSVVISIKTENPSKTDVRQPPENPEELFGGLRPDLMFLSGEIKSESYI